jgi:hypothetical protein
LAVVVAVSVAVIAKAALLADHVKVVIERAVSVADPVKVVIAKAALVADTVMVDVVKAVLLVVNGMAVLRTKLLESVQTVIIPMLMRLPAVVLQWSKSANPLLPKASSPKPVELQVRTAQICAVRCSPWW